MANVNDQFTPDHGHGQDAENEHDNEELEAGSAEEEDGDTDEQDEGFSFQSTFESIEDAVARHPLYAIGAVFAAGLVAGKFVSMLTTPRRRFQMW